MSANNRFLIIGGDSLIGGLLRGRWQQEGRDVAATTRRQTALEPGWLRLDMAELSDWTPPFSGGVAVLCAALANQNQCRREPAATRHINVGQTIALARSLLDRNYFVLFLSTNAVYDGSKPGRRTDEPVCPMTEYGRQKAEVEAFLTKFPDQTAVLRLGKVVHRELAIFRSWMEAFLGGKVINPFSDYFCSPIPLGQALEAAAKIAERRLPGIWHATAKDDISYGNMARLLADKHGFPQRLVLPAPAPVGLLEELPRHTSLDVSRSERELGMTFATGQEVIQAV